MSETTPPLCKRTDGFFFGLVGTPAWNVYVDGDNCKGCKHPVAAHDAGPAPGQAAAAPKCWAVVAKFHVEPHDVQVIRYSIRHDIAPGAPKGECPPLLPSDDRVSLTLWADTYDGARKNYIHACRIASDNDVTAEISKPTPCDVPCHLHPVLEVLPSSAGRSVPDEGTWGPTAGAAPYRFQVDASSGHTHDATDGCHLIPTGDSTEKDAAVRLLGRPSEEACKVRVRLRPDVHRAFDRFAFCMSFTADGFFSPVMTTALPEEVRRLYPEFIAKFRKNIRLSPFSVNAKIEALRYRIAMMAIRYGHPLPEHVRKPAPVALGRLETQVSQPTPLPGPE